uniref:PHD-type domain-containing protein n=1 Tax=Amphimedon queenslandica TaxID=400682 RepID=A0A1X7TKZ1_AMPQE
MPPKKQRHICPICEEQVVDSRHNSIFCDGSCSTWLHHGCAGLTKRALSNLEGSVEPFVCPSCRLVEQSSALTSLKLELASLKAKVAELTQRLSPASHDSPARTPSESSSSDRAAPQGINQSNTRELSRNGGVSRQYLRNAQSHDRRQNLIFFGIQESPSGTPFSERMEHDYNEVFSTINPLIVSDHPSHLHASICACSRLGKFDGSSQRPRPILVRFNTAFTIRTILRNLSQLSSSTNIHIRRDLSREERHINSILLKERYRLVTECDVPKDNIRFRGKSLLINGTLHGEVVGDGFVISESQVNSVEVGGDDSVAASSHGVSVDSPPPPSPPSPSHPPLHASPPSLD